MAIDLGSFLLPGQRGHIFSYLFLLLFVRGGKSGAHKAQWRSQVCCARVLYLSLPELAVPDPQFGAKFLREILLERVGSL